MIVLLTITVDSREARVSFICDAPVWFDPGYVVLPPDRVAHGPGLNAAALRASYEAHGRGRRARPPHPADPADLP